MKLAPLIAVIDPDGAGGRQTADPSVTVRTGAQPPKYQSSNRVRRKLCPATGMPGHCDRVRHGAEQYRMRCRAGLLELLKDFCGVGPLTGHSVSVAQASQEGRVACAE